MTAALSRCDGVVEIRRCWAEFRGPSGGRVRVYAPVLADARAAAPKPAAD